MVEIPKDIKERIQSITDVFTYTMIDTQYRNEQHTPIQPTETDWRKFRRTLDDLNIWQWRNDYPNPGICDGTGWSFDIAYSDHAIATQGDNNYPDAKGNPTNEPHATKAFNRFLLAISKLTKRSFE